MSMLGASTVVKSPLLSPVGESKRQDRNRIMRSNIECVVCSQFRPLNGRSVLVKIAKHGGAGVAAQVPLMDRRRKVGMNSTTRQSSFFICAAALSARCSASQTQTLPRKPITINDIPEKPPLIDDNGGSGGGNFSGGFFLFGFLLFLSFLKDKESEGGVVQIVDGFLYNSWCKSCVCECSM